MPIITLIGPSGSGKTSTGKVLAGSLKYDFLDTDEYIEKQMGMSIEKIFVQYGESFFRNLEQQLVNLLISENSHEKRNNIILSTGGGLPCFGNLMLLLENSTKTIYLTAALEVLVMRIKLSHNRPLLFSSLIEAELDFEDKLKQNLGNLIHLRKEIYERARYKIDTSSLFCEEVAEKIIRLLARDC